MQHRDSEFSRWRHSLEAAKESTDRPGVVIAHSLGNLVFRSFVQWLEHEFEKEEVLTLARTEGGVIEDISNTFFYYAGYEVYESSAEVTDAMITEAKVKAKRRLEKVRNVE